MTPTQGRKPKTGDKPLRVKFANGLVSRWTYTASQLRFTITGSEWDIESVERA
jgi:hypothetical protein